MTPSPDIARRSLAGAGDLLDRLPRPREHEPPHDGEAAPWIAAFTGYANDAVATVHARVLRNPPPRVPSEHDGRWRNVRDTIRRFRTDEVAHARVRITVGHASVDAAADADGHVAADVPLTGPSDALGGWANARVSLLSPRRREPARVARVRLLVPSPAAAFGVVSDLDDTVIRSDVTRPVRMILTLALRNAHTRLPFEGVAAFYRALRDGATAPNPLFYVSSSPWNLYDLLADFLRLQDIPHGPLLLRDWGAGGGGIPLAHGSHKRAAINRIMDRYPALPFILIGDSGQEDPEIYASVLHDHPGRILAVYIRDVTRSRERSKAIARLAREARRAGGTLMLVADTLAAARHAAERGWIDASRLGEIASERDADHGDRSAVTKGRQPPPRGAAGDA